MMISPVARVIIGSLARVQAGQSRDGERARAGLITADFAAFGPSQKQVPKEASALYRELLRNKTRRTGRLSLGEVTAGLRASYIAPCGADARLGCTACIIRCWRPTWKHRDARPARMRVPDPQPGRRAASA